MVVVAVVCMRRRRAFRFMINQLHAMHAVCMCMPDQIRLRWRWPGPADRHRARTHWRPRVGGVGDGDGDAASVVVVVISTGYAVRTIYSEPGESEPEHLTAHSRGEIIKP